MRNLTIAAVFYFAFLFPGLPYPHQTQSQTQTEKMNKMIGILQLERVTKKVMKCFFWFVCIILLNSCDDNVIQSALIGDWQIDSITYKGNNSLFCLNSNYLIFNNNDVKFPSSQYRCESLSNLEEKGKWGVKLNKDNKGLSLDIITGNHLFKGHYKVLFWGDDEKHDLILLLVSNEVNIKAKKVFCEYQNNKGLIDYLTKITSKQ